MHRRAVVAAGLVAGGLGVLTGCLTSVLTTPSDQAAAGRQTPADGQRPAARAVVAVPENARPGTTAWRLGRAGGAHEIEGYADRVSVLPGESFRLFVSTTASEFRVTAYRMGWYGGALGREVWASAGDLPGRVQPPPVLLPGTNTVTTRWTPSVTVSTTGWPPGAYLLKLAAGTGGHRFVPVVVRSPSAQGRVVLVLAVNTWQAYNSWGGYSLYAGPDGSSLSRSRAVSFDRPYDRSGAPKFLAFDRPIVAEAERLGLPTAYVTSVDVASEPGVLDGARAVLSLGHDEYWTPAMRAAFTAARDHGSNLAFLGANAVYWRVRYGATPLGPDRLLIGYKSVADPVASWAPRDTTVQFRQPPAADPEETLVGQRYDCFAGHAAYRVQTPGFWGFRGTGVRRGSTFAGLLGVEVDAATALPTTPRPLQVVAASPYVCEGLVSVATSTYYTTPSGAGVFSVGTMGWAGALAGRPGLPPATSAFVRSVTDTVLRVFAAGPAAPAHPARDNLTRVTAGR